MSIEFSLEHPLGGIQFVIPKGEGSMSQVCCSFNLLRVLHQCCQLPSFIQILNQYASKKLLLTYKYFFSVNPWFTASPGMNPPLNNCPFYWFKFLRTFKYCNNKGCVILIMLNHPHLTLDICGGIFSVCVHVHFGTKKKQTKKNNKKKTTLVRTVALVFHLNTQFFKFV